MKKLVILSMAATMLLSFTQLKAESARTKELKSEIKTTKRDLRLEKKELHSFADNGISYQTKQDFYRNFGNISNVRWNNSGPMAEADFLQNGKNVKAFFDHNSKLVGTSSTKTFAEIPTNAQKRIRSEYKHYKVGDVIFFKDNKANSTNMILYGTPFEDADNYFVEVTKPHAKDIVLQVTPNGEVSFFQQL